MQPIQTNIHHHRGHFFIEENGERLAEMEVGIVKNELVIYHTEVSKKLAGKGVGKQLVEKAIEYAKEHHHLIVPLCPFAYALFKKNEAWKELWKMPG